VPQNLRIPVKLRPDRPDQAPTVGCAPSLSEERSEADLVRDNASMMTRQATPDAAIVTVYEM
jgi:hypothetical protein